VPKDPVHETELALKAVEDLMHSAVLSTGTHRQLQELKARLEMELAALKAKESSRESKSQTP
jgi:hypothetical protein